MEITTIFIDILATVLLAYAVYQTFGLLPVLLMAPKAALHMLRAVLGIRKLLK